MITFVEMPEKVAIDLAGYLHKKYRERVRNNPDDQPEYTLVRFAADIGIEYDTLNSLYNKKGGSKGIQWGVLKKLAKHFPDFLETFDLLPDS